MKLLVQASDYGFTRASTYGVIDSIDLGLVRNTGLFVNMPTAKFAIDLLKTRTNVCLGLDFNITNGPCVSNPQKIPHLVDKEGNFIRSSVRVKDPRFQTEEGRREMFPYQECLLEMNAQYQLFLKLTGKRPGYLHDHSLSHENYTDTIRQLSKEYRVPYTRDIQEKYHFGSLGKKMYPEAFAMNKEIDYEKQIAKNPEKIFWENINEVMQYEYFILSGHAAYIDADLLELSSCSIERCKDAALCMSPRLKKWIEEYQIELITYNDLK